MKQSILDVMKYSALADIKYVLVLVSFEDNDKLVSKIQSKTLESLLLSELNKIPGMVFATSVDKDKKPALSELRIIVERVSKEQVKIFFNLEILDMFLSKRIKKDSLATIWYRQANTFIDLSLIGSLERLIIGFVQTSCTELMIDCLNTKKKP